MTELQKLNKKFTDCKNHRDFYIYFRDNRNKLIEEEKLWQVNNKRKQSSNMNLMVGL